MAWRTNKVEDQRKAFIIAVLEDILPMAELCRRYNISRKCGYKWLERYNLGGFEALDDQSRAPHNQALKTNDDVVRQILEVRFRYPTWGPKKVRAWLIANCPGTWPSTTTIGNLFDKNGLTIPRKFRKRVPAKTVPLSHCQQPNDVWCTDFKGWFITGDGEKCDPFTLTDASSRFLLRCLKLDANDVDHVWAVLDVAFREFGLPKYLRNDNGPPFATCGVGRLSKLSIKLIKAGVIPEWIDPGEPQQNGRHERMHLTLKNETTRPPQASLAQQEKKFQEFIQYYNYVRPHEAIDQKTPGSVYQPSPRRWSGHFKPPEYSSEYIVRKIREGGHMTWKHLNIYVGRALVGEYIGLKPIEDGIYRAYYGPIILGELNQNNEFKIPQRNTRRRNCRITDE